MGKQRRERRRPHKENPTGLPSLKDFEKAESEDYVNEDREAALQRMHEDIQSPTTELKINGLQTLESMSSASVDLAIQIANDGIAKEVGPLLLDDSIPVRAAAATALRTLVEHGRSDAYTYLLRDDIMTPLSALIKKYHAEWKPKDHKKEGTDDNKIAFVQAVTLLWALCENNESAVKYSNEEEFVSVLAKFFDVPTYGTEVATVVAQCLLALSDDNPSAITHLKEYEAAFISLLNSEISNTAESEVICLKILIAGLLLNLNSTNDIDSISIICKIVTVINDTLAVDCKTYLDTLLSVLPHEKNTFSPTAKKRVQDSRKVFGAQQQALEFLANLCSEDQDTDNESDLNDSDVEDDEDDSMDVDSANNGSYKLVSALPPEVTEVLNNCNIVEKVWERTLPVEETAKEILEQTLEGKLVLRQLHTLRCRSYLCLNNLLSCLETETLGGTDAIYKMWMEIGTTVVRNVAPNDIELLESATSAMRAGLQRLSEEKANVFTELTVKDLEPMSNGVRNCPNANVRRNLIRVFGSLGLILMNTDIPRFSELIKHISSFLLEICTSEAEAWVIAEALDTIMDLYSEDESDQLAKEIQLVTNLQNIVPHFKNKVRKQKKQIGENAPVVSTVNVNVTRFIKYKAGRIKNSS